MLAYFNRFFRRHAQAIQQSLISCQRSPWATAGTVGMIGAILILPLLFGFLVQQLKPLTNEWRYANGISLYLDNTFQTRDVAAIVARISAVNGVAQVEFISADDNLAALEKQDGMEDLRKYLPENPLPSMIEVTPSHVVDTPEKMENLCQTLSHIPQVEQVKMNHDLVSRMYALLNFLTQAARVFGLLFCCMVVFTIRNLLRLSAQAHQNEIQVLKLVGATDSFIIRPFLYRGALLGGGGAAVAFCVVHCLLMSLRHTLQALFAPGFGMSFSAGLSIKDAGAGILLGLGLGWLGAYLSLKRQLVSIEPYA